jgi:MFS family permease
LAACGSAEGIAVSLALFFLAESIFHLGLATFFLLYNLHLLDLGFDESFLGLSASAIAAGSVCGTLPAGWFCSRFGVGPALNVTFLGGAGACALLAWATDRNALLALAFLAGLAAAFRLVTIAPAVSQLTSEETRSQGFSRFFALAIGMGIVAGVVGGRLPSYMTKQYALWLASAFAALAVVPAGGLRFQAAARDVVYPRHPFVRRYLVAVAVWGLFMGSFPAVYNAYFAKRMAASTSQIGLIYAVSQIAQVTAILVAPRVFARVGLVRGIASSQVAAALFLALLAPLWPLAVAGGCYAAYMAFQYMSEPGWQTLLMNGVTATQRSGASSLNFCVMLSAQAVGAALFGWFVARSGYPGPLVVTAVVGWTAAWITSQMFRR